VHAKRLLAEGAAWATPQGQVLLASLSRSDGKRERARELLSAAVLGFDGAKMALHAASTRCALGVLLGGSEGRAMVREAEAFMLDQGVHEPRAFSATLVPEFGEPPPGANSKATGRRS
jgi:hypothetical protein